MLRNRSRWLLALAGAGLIIAWLSQPVPYKASGSTGLETKTSQPEWSGHGISQWQAARDGQRLFIEARQASHFRHDGLTTLQQPSGTLIRGANRYDFHAREGQLTPKQVQLIGRAHLEARLSDQPEPITLSAQALTYLPARHHLHTPTAVRITQGASWITGTGLDWWLDRQRLTLKRNVTSEYHLHGKGPAARQPDADSERADSGATAGP